MTEKNFDWAAPGKEVAITYSDYGRTRRIDVKTVDRQTATQIIVDGTRYSKRDLREIRARSTWSSPNPLLSPLDDPKVQAGLSEQTHHAFAARMQLRVTTFDKQPSTEAFDQMQHTLNSWRIHVFGK